MIRQYTAYSLLAHNTFGIEAKAARYVEFASQSALIDFLGDGFRGKALVIGGGSNLLFVDDFDGTVYHSAIMDIDLIEETADDVLLRVGTRLWLTLLKRGGADWRTCRSSLARLEQVPCRMWVRMAWRPAT